jgi:uncharacterized protein YndB with AHSA1/START domain
MADIIHEFNVKARPELVFPLFASPNGLEKWWTKSSSGESREGGVLRLYFGPQFDWQGKVTRCVPPSLFELEMVNAHPDWVGTRVRCELTPDGNDSTRVIFRHTGWPEQNEHWRVSCYCWAMYLRILRRNLEHGETVEYEQRLDV